MDILAHSKSNVEETHCRDDFNGDEQTTLHLGEPPITTIPRDIWTMVGFYLRVVDIDRLLRTGNRILRNLIQDGLVRLGDLPETDAFQTLLNPQWYFQFKNLRSLTIQARFLCDPEMVTILNHVVDLRELHIYNFQNISNATFAALPKRLETLLLVFDVNVLDRYVRLHHSFLSYIPSSLRKLYIHGTDASFILYSHEHYSLCRHLIELDLLFEAQDVISDENISFDQWQSLTRLDLPHQYATNSLLTLLTPLCHSLRHLSCRLIDFNDNLRLLPSSLTSLRLRFHSDQVRLNDLNVSRMSGLQHLNLGPARIGKDSDDIQHHGEWMSLLPTGLKSLNLTLRMNESALQCTLQNLPRSLQSFQLYPFEIQSSNAANTSLLETLPPALTKLILKGVRFRPDKMPILPRSITSLHLSFHPSSPLPQTDDSLESSNPLPNLRRFSTTGPFYMHHVQQYPFFYACAQDWHTISMDNIVYPHFPKNLTSINIPSLDENHFGILGRNLRSISISNVEIHDQSGIALKHLPDNLGSLYLNTRQLPYEPTAVIHLPRFIETLRFAITFVDENTWRDYPILLNELTLRGPDFVNGNSRPITRRISEAPRHLKTVSLFQEAGLSSQYQLRCGLRSFIIEFTDGLDI